MKEKIKDIQRKVGVAADGIMGPVTVEAILERLEERRAVCPAAGLRNSGPWPTQAEVRSGRSVFGAPGEAALVNVAPPYPLFYEGKQVRSIRVHRVVAPVVLSALQQVLDEYGPERIRALGLDQYGGSYNYRQTTGASSLSMHAWGIALDFCPAGNGMSVHAPAATLSHPDCRRWWEIWESFGAVSMGRQRDYDWMHLQFARL